MIALVGIWELIDGADAVDAVKKTGDEISEIQVFLPNGTTGNSVSNTLKNAVDNNKTIKNLDGDKLVTKNLDGTQEKIVVVTKENNGTIYTGNATNNLDEIADDVLKKADPDDIVDLAEDVTTYNYYKTQPQKFKDGKEFEKNITSNSNHKSQVQTVSGINLTGFNRVEQAQIKMPDNSYFVADNVWYKSTNVNGETVYEVVINESKLSNAAPFTARQNAFLSALTANSNLQLQLRSAKFGLAFPQGAKLKIKAYVNTIGNGTPTGGYSVVLKP